LLEAARESIWLNTLLGDFGIQTPDPIMIHYDNESSIRLARNPVLHSRTKHISVHYHFAREQLENGAINVTYISTRDQLADLFTKPLIKPLFEHFRQGLLIISSSEALQQIELVQ
jgi:hypothetical protein